VIPHFGARMMMIRSGLGPVFAMMLLANALGIAPARAQVSAKY